MKLKQYIKTLLGVSLGVFLSQYYIVDSDLEKALQLAYHCLFTGVLVGYFCKGD